MCCLGNVILKDWTILFAVIFLLHQCCTLTDILVVYLRCAVLGTSFWLFEGLNKLSPVSDFISVRHCPRLPLSWTSHAASRPYEISVKYSSVGHGPTTNFVRFLPPSSTMWTECRAVSGHGLWAENGMIGDWFTSTCHFGFTMLEIKCRNSNKELLSHHPCSRRPVLFGQEFDASKYGGDGVGS